MAGTADKKAETGRPAAAGKRNTRRDVAGGSPAQAGGVRDGTDPAHSVLWGALNGSARLDRLGSDPFSGSGRAAGAGVRSVLHSEPVSWVRSPDYCRIPADPLAATSRQLTSRAICRGGRG